MCSRTQRRRKVLRRNVTASQWWNKFPDRRQCRWRLILNLHRGNVPDLILRSTGDRSREISVDRDRSGGTRRIPDVMIATGTGMIGTGRRWMKGTASVMHLPGLALLGLAPTGDSRPWARVVLLGPVPPRTGRPRTLAVLGLVPQGIGRPLASGHTSHAGAGSSRSQSTTDRLAGTGSFGNRPTTDMSHAGAGSSGNQSTTSQSSRAGTNSSSSQSTTDRPDGPRSSENRQTADKSRAGSPPYAGSWPTQNIMTAERKHSDAESHEDRQAVNAGSAGGVSLSTANRTTGTDVTDSSRKQMTVSAKSSPAEPVSLQNQVTADTGSYRSSENWTGDERNKVCAGTPASEMGSTPRQESGPAGPFFPERTVTADTLDSTVTAENRTITVTPFGVSMTTDCADHHSGPVPVVDLVSGDVDTHMEIDSENRTSISTDRDFSPSIMCQEKSCGESWGAWVWMNRLAVRVIQGIYYRVQSHVRVNGHAKLAWVWHASWAMSWAHCSSSWCWKLCRVSLH